MGFSHVETASEPADLKGQQLQWPPVGHLVGMRSLL